MTLIEKHTVSSKDIIGESVRNFPRAAMLSFPQNRVYILYVLLGNFGMSPSKARYFGHSTGGKEL